jgi:hypothetical protein
LFAQQKLALSLSVAKPSVYSQSSSTAEQPYHSPLMERLVTVCPLPARYISALYALQVLTPYPELNVAPFELSPSSVTCVYVPSHP